MVYGMNSRWRPKSAGVEPQDGVEPQGGKPPEAPEPSPCRDLVASPPPQQAPARTGGYSARQARRKIAESDALDKILDYIAGRCEMEPAKVNAALSLIKKIVPDLSPLALPQDEEDWAETARAAASVIEFRIVDPKS